MSDIITAKIARLTGPRELIFEEAALDPSTLAPDSVLAETLVSALSVGTEMAAYMGKPPLRPGPIYPRVVGYCNVARLLHVGSEVKNYQVGDLVLSFQSHRSAFICKAADLLLKVPADMDLGAAATTYLFHLGYSSLMNSDFRPGSHVAVIGLGVLGMGVIASGQMGGGRMAGFSNQEENLHQAEQLGADRGWLKSDPASITDYVASTGIGGADIVVLTSDTWEDWLLALKLARKKGTLAVISFPGRGQPPPDFNPLDSQYFYDKQLVILPAASASRQQLPPHEIRYNCQRNCEYLLEMIKQGRLPARQLISAEHDWSELNSVYAALENRQGGNLTHLLKWK